MPDAAGDRISMGDRLLRPDTGDRRSPEVSGGMKMKTKCKCAAMGSGKSGLVAAIAVLAIAFVLLAAVPVAVTESDAEVSSSDVAKIGDTGYATVAAAITAATGESNTIILLKDVAEDVSIAADKAIILDLNGFKLTNKTGHTITNAGTLTVKDSSEKKTGTVDNITHQKAALHNNAGAIATLNGGTFDRSKDTALKIGGSAVSAPNSWYTIVNQGTMYINSGVVIQNFNPTAGQVVDNATSTIRNVGTSATHAAMIIDGATVDGGYNALKNDEYGEMTIKSGTFTNQIQVALFNYGDAIIEGGKFGAAQSALYNRPIDDNGKAGNLTVNGGVFTYGKGYADVWNKADGGVGKITVGKNVKISFMNVVNIDNTGASMKTTMELSEGSSVSFTKESIMPASITYDGSSAAFENVIATENVTISAGSIQIEGEFSVDSSTGTITVTGKAVISGNSTLDKGTKLIVDTGAKLKVASGTFKVAAGAEVEIKGEAEVQKGAKLVVEEKTESAEAAKVTIDGSGAELKADSGSSVLVGGTIEVKNDATMTSDTTITVISKDATLPEVIGGEGSVDSSSVTAEGTISGEWNTITTYTQNQVITLTGDTTLVSGSQIVMKGKLVIPENITLTIEDGAQLVVYTSTGTIENSGAIVVKSSAGAVYDATKKWEQISGATERGGLVNLHGTIMNDGIIQLDYDLAGGPGDYAANPQLNNIGKLTNDGHIYVGAESGIGVGSELGNSSTGVITIEGQYTTYDGASILNAGALIIKGAIKDGMNVSFTGADAYIQIDSVKGSSGSDETIDVNNGFKDTSTVTYEGSASLMLKVKNGFTFSGLQIIPSMMKKTADPAGKTYLRYIDIAGRSATQAGDGVTYPSGPVVELEQNGNAIVSTELTLPSGVQMSINGATKVTGTVTSVYSALATGSSTGGIELKDVDASLTVTGKVTTVVKEITVTNGKINAACYGISASGTVSASYIYTTLDQAVSDEATKIEIKGDTSVSADVTVPSGTTVAVLADAVLTVDAEKTLTFASGAVLKNSGTKIDVQGTLYIEVAKTGLKPEGTIDSQVVVKGDKDRMYTTLATALGLASAGSTVELSGNVTLTADLTIPAGKTVDTNGKKIIVPVDRTLTVDGELYLNGTDSTVTLEKRNPAFIQNDGKIVLNGTVSSTEMLSSRIMLGSDPYTVGGAYYSITVKAETTYYVEPVAAAAESIALVDDSRMEIRAGVDGLKVGDLSFTGTSTAPATVEVYTKLVASSITLDMAAVSFKADSAFEGTITNGVGTVILAGKAMTDFAVASTTTKDVKALVVSGQFVDDGKDDKFVVSGEVTLNGVDLDMATVDGTAKVSDNSTVDSLTINGTVSVDNGFKLVVADDLQVLGSLSAAEMTNEGPAAQVTAGKIFAGISKKNAYDGSYAPPTTGAAATITGNVTSTYVLVADGSSVPDSIVKATNVVSTEYIVDGKAYVTVYATSNHYIGLVKASAENGDFKGWYVGSATTADVSNKYVGASGYEKVSAIIDYEIYSIYVIAEAGIENLAVDGNLMLYGSIGGTGNVYYTYGLKAGVHKITYTLKNGYSGEAKLSLVDSEKTTASVSGMDVSISGAKGDVYLQLTGIEKSGYSPDSDKKIDGLTVTEILLIVLVVLVVIMAVIVALRLMRS